jgi:hypothetical protein
VQREAVGEGTPHSILMIRDYFEIPVFEASSQFVWGAPCTFSNNALIADHSDQERERISHQKRVGRCLIGEAQACFGE